MLQALRELGESKMSLIMKPVRVGAGGGVLLAVFPLGVTTVGEELDALPEDTEVRVGRLLLLVHRAAASGLMPKLKVAGLASVK